MYVIEMFPLTDAGVFMEGEEWNSLPEAVKEMEDWARVEGWTLEAAEGGAYLVDSDGTRLYCLTYPR